MRISDWSSDVCSSDLHPGRSADVFRDGVPVGWIGQLHPRLQRALDLDHPVVAFEIDLVPLRERAVPRARPLSKFPSVRRDLAFVVPEQVSWQIGRASCRERVCQYVYISVVAVSLKKKKRINQDNI